MPALSLMSADSLPAPTPKAWPLYEIPRQWSEESPFSSHLASALFRQSCQRPLMTVEAGQVKLLTDSLCSGRKFFGSRRRSVPDDWLEQAPVFHKKSALR